MDGTLTGIKSPVLRQGLEYWTAQRSDRVMPARADLDPMDMIAILPHVVLLDVQRDPLDFRYRLIGTVVEEHMATRYTGCLMSDIAHQRAPSRIWSSCQRVTEEKRPFSSDIPYVGPKKDFLTVEDVVMPLSSDGETVDMIFAVVAYLRSDQFRG